MSTGVAWWSSLEDTFVAPGFSWQSWELIRKGMTRADVERLLGPPITEELKPAFARAQFAECWVSNLSVGYFATVWFESGRVTRTQFWYSD